MEIKSEKEEKINLELPSPATGFQFMSDYQYTNYSKIHAR